MTLEKLEKIFLTVVGNTEKEYVHNSSIAEKIQSVCTCERNKAPIRYLLSAMISKMDDETIDTRQPYPNLGSHSFAGRSVDEAIVQPFIHKYQLPCNDNQTVTCYEMKKKQVTTDDIYVCVEKIALLENKPDNYIIITTDTIIASLHPKK